MTPAFDRIKEHGKEAWTRRREHVGEIEALLHDI